MNTLPIGGILVRDQRGLRCPAGGFWVDPWRGVDRAVITHAHSDHARPGSKCYLTAQAGVDVLRLRLGTKARIEGVEYGESINVGQARMTLFPAGHVLGSAQVRIEVDGRVVVVSGDYKLAHDRTCATFEPVRCDAFVTEATFALPVYHWRPTEQLFDDINAWWSENHRAGCYSVIQAYALGKAQRILAYIDPGIGPILIDEAVHGYVSAYRRQGVSLPETISLTPAHVRRHPGAMILASSVSAEFLSLYARQHRSTAMVSGWMHIGGLRRKWGVDRGFALSDHADWDGLNAAIAATGASEVWATHGYSAILARWLRDRGLNAQAMETEYRGELDDPQPPSVTSEAMLPWDAPP